MMKFTLTFLSIILVTMAFAQDRSVERGHDLPFLSGWALDTRSADTIGPASNPGCDLTPNLLSTSAGGWVTGTNGYGDLEKAQQLVASTEGPITAALILFGDVEIVGSPNNFVAKIYSDEGEGPATLLATSDPVSSANFETGGGLTRFDFPEPAVVSGSFFVSLEVGVGDDVIGIAHSTGLDCGNASAWEMWDNGAWYDIVTAWGGTLNIIMFMYAEMGEGVSTSNMIITPGSHYVYPNPSFNSSMLVYNLVSDTEVSIVVTDIQGRVISETARTHMPAGSHNMHINASGLSAGVYFYQIITGEETVQGRFLVQ